MNSDPQRKFEIEQGLIKNLIMHRKVILLHKLDEN